MAKYAIPEITDVKRTGQLKIQSHTYSETLILNAIHIVDSRATNVNDSF